MTHRHLLRPLAIALSIAALSGCAGQDRILSAYPGTDSQIRTYYEANAFEFNATCTTPYISTITQVQVVRDDERQLILDVDYLYDVRVRFADYGLAACRNFAERRFTFEKTDGGLRLTGMTGEQRARPATGG